MTEPHDSSNVDWSPVKKRLQYCEHGHRLAGNPDIEALIAEVDRLQAQVAEHENDIWMNTYAAMRRARDAAQNELSALAETVNLQATELERLRQIEPRRSAVIEAVRAVVDEWSLNPRAATSALVLAMAALKARLDAADVPAASTGENKQ